MKNLIIVLLFIFTLFIALPANAQTVTPGSSTLRTSKMLKPSGAVQETRKIVSGNLNQRTISEIDRQISLLQALVPKVDGLTHLTPEERSTLSTQIQTEITNLQTLKSRVEGVSEDAALKTNIKNVLSAHKNFSFYIPQIRLLMAAESIDSTANRILETAKKIEKRIDTQDAADTAEITPLLENMQAKANNAKAQSNAITAAVSPLTASSFPASKATLQSAQTKLKTGMTDIRSALKDLKEVLQLLKKTDIAGTSTPTLEDR